MSELDSMENVDREANNVANRACLAADIDKARADFTRVVLNWVRTNHWPDNVTEESDEIAELAVAASLIELRDTPDQPYGYDQMYFLTELGEQAASPIQ